MRASAPGQSALLMTDVAELLARQGVRYAVIGAMAAAVHGVVRASLDADAVVALPARETQALRQSLIEEGHEVVLRTGDVDDPIPGLLEVRDRFGNRVDLLLGLRGMDPELLNRTRQVRLGEVILAIVGREDFIAMKAFAGGPVDLADARAVIELDRKSLDLELLRRLAQRFGRNAARVVEDLMGAVDE
jgi:predicted nucleotidyltransferase